MGARVTDALTIDLEFARLIPPLLPEEFERLESNILRDECHEPLSVWQGLLLDGHNRFKICKKHSMHFSVKEVLLDNREHAKLWISDRQLGRRNLSDDVRAMVADDRRKILSEIARKERAKVAGKAGGRHHPKVSLSDDVADKLKKDTREEVARGANLSERKIKYARSVKNADPVVAAMVMATKISLVEGMRLIALSGEIRATAIKEIENGVEVRAAIRSAKKESYNKKIAKSKPKALEDSYRIFYADPPWKYHGLNQADEHGHAERHYDCLDDVQLCEYKPGQGQRMVKDMAEDNAVLFMWVTSPLLERCFAVIRAWGFEYKASFVWDKVKHVMGHYNSVRHELLLICTRGSCTPDIPKLVDSVQSIERSDKHSEKPTEFYSIIEGMYDHGRKLELFSRSVPRDGWDQDGNESLA
jgi:N6-adenosine-specific RNA methylase IME4